MSQRSVRKFDVSPNQYELFRFTVPEPTTLYLRMIASDPVNVVFLDSEDRAEYVGGNPTYTYQNTWARRTSLENALDVDPGTWYIAIEGRDEPSKGRIEVYQ